MTILEFLGDDWQLSHALARGSEDGVGDGGSNRRNRAFAESSRRTVGSDDVDFDFRRLIHADYNPKNTMTIPLDEVRLDPRPRAAVVVDRKSTRLNSSH